MDSFFYKKSNLFCPCASKKNLLKNRSNQALLKNQTCVAHALLKNQTCFIHEKLRFFEYQPTMLVSPF